MKHLIAPSILSADFSKLAEEVHSVEKGGADWIHVDVMDGHFVPNLTIGPLVVKALRPVTKLPLDCHLMVSDPAKWIDEFADAGANSITVHIETSPHIDRVLHHIKERGCRAGISLDPGTPLVMIEEVLDQVELVLVMSVNPGFGGQQFIESSVSKVKRLVELRGKRKFQIEIDGGVKASNIKMLADAGVDVFVAGSSIFQAKDRAQSIKALRDAIGTS
jgi:ribulose-phosphate 3-epimerase